MKKTIENEAELSGMIKMLIELFDSHQSSINEDYGLCFKVKLIGSTYNVLFNWTGDVKNVIPATEDGCSDYEYYQCDDSFSIREDESLSKLEQFVSDALFTVIQTQLRSAQP